MASCVICLTVFVIYGKKGTTDSSSREFWRLRRSSAAVTLFLRTSYFADLRHQLLSALSPIDASASENGGPMGPAILWTNLCKLPQSQRAHDLTSHTLTYVLTRVADSDQRNSNLWGHTRKMSRNANADVSAVAISSVSHPLHCWPPLRRRINPYY